jgi:hypothetical protein
MLHWLLIFSPRFCLILVLAIGGAAFSGITDQLYGLDRLTASKRFTAIENVKRHLSGMVCRTELYLFGNKCLPVELIVNINGAGFIKK